MEFKVGDIIKSNPISNELFLIIKLNIQDYPLVYSLTFKDTINISHFSLYTSILITDILRESI